MYYDSYDSVQWENESNIRIIIIFDVLFFFFFNRWFEVKGVNNKGKNFVLNSARFCIRKNFEYTLKFTIGIFEKFLRPLFPWNASFVYFTLLLMINKSKIIYETLSLPCSTIKIKQIWILQLSDKKLNNFIIKS